MASRNPSGKPDMTPLPGVRSGRERGPQEAQSDPVLHLRQYHGLAAALLQPQLRAGDNFMFCRDSVPCCGLP